jgi:SAM-dependent methyltransferase
MDRHEWDRRYEGHDLVWTAEPNRFVREAVAGLAPGSALDLACGEGRNAVWLAGRGWTVTGVDFSEVALAKARALAERRGVEGVRLVTADLTTFVPARGAFDLVVVAYLQLPAAALGPILDRAIDAVAPGGTFFLVAHDRANLECGHGGPRSPDVLYGAADVTPRLSGFTIVESGVRERPVDLDGGGRAVALDAVVRAVLVVRSPDPADDGG